MKGYYEVLLVYSSTIDRKQFNITRRFSSRKLAKLYKDKQEIGSTLFSDYVLFSVSDVAYISFDDIIALV